MTSGIDPTKEQVSAEAADLKDTVAGHAAEVGSTAKQEATNVAAEAKYQAKGMLDESVSQLRTQASTGQSRLAEVVRDLAREAGQMSSVTDGNGMMTRLAGDASRVGDDVARWLDSREPEDVLDEVRRFAARRPGTFLAVALGAGFLAGRFIRGMQSDLGPAPQNRQLTSGREPYRGYFRDPYGQSAGQGFAQPGRYGAGEPYETSQYAPTQYAAGDQYASGSQYTSGIQYDAGGQVSQAPASGQPASEGEHLYSYSEDADRMGGEAR